MYKDYDPQVLARLQRIELEMLRDFSALCEKHQIDYFGCGGTLLGAIRHGGFIPWDDDIDIGMTREHYDKFLAVAGQEYGDRYRLINTLINDAFPCMITKWYKTGTVFRDQDAVTTGYTAGIAIDIFCFDNVADELGELRKQAMRAWIWGKLLVLRAISSPTIYLDGITAKLTRGAARGANLLLKMLPLSTKYLFCKADHAASGYRDLKTGRVAFLFDPTPYTSMLKRSDIYPTRMLPFEDMMLRFPNRPEVYLATRYGNDYMTPPPVSKRHNHPPVELDFGHEEES